MHIKEDTTFRDLRQKSVMSWLDTMVDHEDIEVRGGVRVTRDYIKFLEARIEALDRSNDLKDHYLKKLKEKQ